MASGTRKIFTQTIHMEYVHFLFIIFTSFKISNSFVLVSSCMDFNLVNETQQNLLQSFHIRMLHSMPQFIIYIK